MIFSYFCSKQRLLVQVRTIEAVLTNTTVYVLEQKLENSVYSCKTPSLLYKSVVLRGPALNGHVSMMENSVYSCKTPSLLYKSVVLRGPALNGHVSMMV